MKIDLGQPLGLLGVVFVALKLMNYIAWSWVWVLAPFWMPLMLFILILVVLLVIKLIVG